MDLIPPYMVDLRRKEDRMKTFKNWPVSFLSPEQMADNGFYYLGSGDEVRCAFCNVQIMKWIEGDDPAKDHQRWAPQCIFLRNSETENKMASPKMFDLRRKEDRMKTFKNWPVSFLSPEQMADNGFYYLGRRDIVCCAFCNMELEKWVNGDDPAQEHQRLAPHCHFVLNPINLETEDRDNMLVSRGRYHITPKNFDALLKFKQYIHTYGNVRSLKFNRSTEQNSKSISSTPSIVKLHLADAVHSNYISEDARLRSFQDSPIHMLQKQENLAEAGFFYVGPEDETKCFYCDGSLKDWEADDVPWEQHARWFGSCAYVQFVKGHDYIQQVMTKGYALPTYNIEKKVTRESERMLIKYPESTTVGHELCIICYAEKRNLCLVPCGHVVVGPKCASNVTKCPLCSRTCQNIITL